MKVSLINESNIRKCIFFVFVLIVYFTFFHLSKDWKGIYRILLPIAPTFLFFLGIYIFYYFKKFKLQYGWFYKTLLFVLNFLIYIFIFDYYSLPYYYFWIFFILILIFSISKYYNLLLISTLIFFYSFIIFQFYLFQQEWILSLIEKSLSLERKIRENILSSIEKEIITLSLKDKSQYKIIFKIPDIMELIDINKYEKEFDLPIFFILREKEKELPLISCMVVPKENSLSILDLRIQSILNRMKQQNRILDYKRIKKDYLQKILQKEHQENHIQSFFYIFYDNFYATKLILGFYAISFDEYMIIIFIREKYIEFLPHSSSVLSFLNSIKY